MNLPSNTSQRHLNASGDLRFQPDTQVIEGRAEKLQIVRRLSRVLALTAVFVLSLVTVVGVYSYTRGGTSARVYAATSSNLNFQARILSSTGAVVSDGNYSVQFKIYSAATGGTAEWTETQATTRVVNGYFSVNLGSVTAFPNTIDWSQDHWLTMNVNGDGEMLGAGGTRIKLTAVPYAFRSGKADALVNGAGLLTADDIVQLAPLSLQTVNGAVAGLRFNQVGTGGLVQLQSSGVDVFTVDNSGNAVFKGALAANGPSVTVGSSTQAGSLILNDGSGYTATVNTGTLTTNRTYTLPDASGTLCLTTTCGGGSANSFIQDGNSFGSLATLGTNDNYGLAFETNNTTQLTILANGNIGIGTTNPLNILDIARNQNNLTTAIIRNTDTGTGAAAGFAAYNDTTALGFFGTTGVNYGSALLQDRAIINANSGLSGIALNTQGAQPIVFGVNTTEVGRFGSTGNFGIGNTSPGSLLTVGASAQFTVNSSGVVNTSGGLNSSAGLAVTAGGATISGGINNSSGGITNTGSITGVGSNITGTSGLTIASGGAGDLVLSSASGILAIGNTTSTVQRTASGNTTIDLADTANTGLVLSNSGTGTASLNLADGALQIGGTTVISSSRALQNVTGTFANGVSFNADTITAGTLSDSRLSANVTLQGNTFNGVNQLVKLDASGFLPTLNGSALTNLNASALATGTVSVARGGTGQNSLTQNGLLFGNGTSPVSSVNGTSGQLLIADASGVPTFVTLSGDATLSSTGSLAIAANSVALGTDTTGDYIANLGTLTGLSVTGNSGEGSTPALSVLYGSGANTAVQGNTQITLTAGTGLTGGGTITLGAGGTVSFATNYGATSTSAVRGDTTLVCPSGTGQLTGGGNTITLGNGGTCNAIAITSTPAFTSVTTSTLTSTAALSISSGGTGDINLDSASNKLVIAASDTTLQRVATGSYTIDLSDSAATSLVLDNSGAGAADLNLNDGSLKIAGTTVLTNARVLQNVTADTSIITSGTFAVNRGGTGATSFTQNGLLFGNGTNPVTAITGSSGQLVIANASGVPTFTTLGGDATIDGAGALAIAANSVALGTDTTGNYIASLGTVTGLTVGGTTGEGAIPTLSVNYGATSTSAVRGDTTLVCPSVSGSNLSGGGNTITLGNGGTCNAIALTNTPAFTSVTASTFTSTGALAINSAASGDISFDSASNKLVIAGSDTTLQRTGTGSFTIDLNDTAATTLVLNNSGTGAADLNLNDGSLQIAGTIVLTNGRVLQNVTADTSIITSGTFAVNRGGTGAATFTTNGVLFGNGTSPIGATAAGTSGQLLIANGSGVPTFVTLSGDATLTSAGALAIAANSVVLGTDTTGNYVQDITGSTGLTVSGSGSESASVSLGLDVTVTGTTATTQSISGLEIGSDGLRILGGCTNGQVLKWNGTQWTCGTDNAGLSDSRLKQNIVTKVSLLDSLKSLRVVDYDFKCADPTLATLRLTCDHQIGVISQEVRAIFPELTYQNADGYYEVNFGGLNFYTLKAVTELAAFINAAGDATLNTVSTNGVMRLTNAGALQNITGLTVTSGGASITGTTAISGALTVGGGNIDLNTGSNSGTVTIGGGSAPLVINSTTLDLSGAGALSGISSLTSNGNILVNSATSGYQIVRGTTTYTGIDLSCGGNQYLNTGVIRGGIITGTSGCTGIGLSDERLKTNIVSLDDNTLDKIKDVNAVNFDFVCSNAYFTTTNTTCDSSHQTGVIAQQLAQVFPELTYQDEQGYYHVKYDALSIYNLKATTEIAKRLDSAGNANVNTLSTNGVLRLSNDGVLQNINGLNIAAGGASLNGGLNNNAGGITNVGALSGVTALNGQSIQLDANATDNLLTLKKDGQGVFTIFNDGAVQLMLNSYAAFNVKSNSGLTHFNIDTNGNLVSIGSATGDDKAILFTLDNKNTAGDPTGVDGGQYYNSFLKKFRCYEDGTWKDCISNTTAKQKTDQAVATTTLTDASDLFLQVAANESDTFEAAINLDAAGATPNLRYTFTAPAGAVVSITTTMPTGATTSTTCNISTSGQICSVSFPGAYRGTLIVKGQIMNGATAGKLQFRFAQDNSLNTSPITLKKGSSLSYVRTDQ